MKNKIVGEFLQSRIAAKDFPSAVYLVAERGEIVFQDALGFAVVEPRLIKARVETIYDLASLTKPLVTGLLCAKLIEANELELKATIDYYLPEFESGAGGGNAAKVRIGELLAHTSRLPAWKPFYLTAANRPAVLADLIATPLDLLQSPVTYSDLNFLILTFLVEKIYAARIDEIAAREIFAPLGLRNTFYNPPPSARENIAASENGNCYEREMVENDFPKAAVASDTFRTQTIWGEVHDGNAFFMNGVSGHAGLFSNALETFKIAQQFLAESTVLLKPETCELFRANLTKGLNEARSLAFQLAATDGSTASASLSADSFGHLGFTGTSLWIEPETERIFILLTNRTHARTPPFVNINPTRRKFHELAAKTLEESEQ